MTSIQDIFLRELDAVASNLGWHYFEAASPSSGADCALISPSGRSFFVEWKAGTGPLHFSAIKKLEAFLHRFNSIRSPETIEPIAVLATSQAISQRMRETVASSSSLIIFEYKSHSKAEDVCVNFLRFCATLTDTKSTADSQSDSESKAQDISIGEINERNITSISGDVAAAKKAYRQLIEKQERLIGEHHPSTLRTRVLFAEMLQERKLLPEADRELREVLAIQQKILGEEHADTLLTRNSLARILQESGRADEAESELRRLLEIESRVFGEDSEKVLNTRGRLANALAELERTSEAEREYRSTIRLAQRSLGPEHGLTLINKGSLGALLYEQGELDEAEDLMTDVADSLKRAYGPDHPLTIWPRTALANIFFTQEKLEDAENEFASILRSADTVLGPSSSDSITAHLGLIQVYTKRREYAKALEHYREISNHIASTHSEDDPLRTLVHGAISAIENGSTEDM